ncbi:MAG: hypothetical protein DUD27_07805 [Lachnospiraceae bacterium]|uniref:ATPase P n=1 Tax=Candidatus Weimeria bifida TaxID=2599074 RepID=A0A6N7IYU7_9FIRM|nr:hypothetical protein [Candidatus Weimeria bifida]RRF95447.1 MAG: hypothetical protein DUD27_07805 [Lachnospiraceae bacterium]
MAKLRSISSQSLDEDEVIEDRKHCRKYSVCGVGNKAIFVPGKIRNRVRYIPFSAVTHVFKRVAYSNADGRGMLAPVLYMVIRYDDGREWQYIFKNMNEADRMLKDISEAAPNIYTMSPAGVEKEKREEELRKKMESKELSEKAQKAIRALQRDEVCLKKSPGLYENLSGMAKIKRKLDLIKPQYKAIAFILLLAGIVGFAVSLVLRLMGLMASGPAVITMLVCAMLIILMINSKVLPGPVKNKRNVDRDYNRALHDMEHFLGGFESYHLPARYSHPVVIEMLKRIIREERAETIDEALEVLKEDLKACDSTKVVSREEYQEIVTVKPMFTVANYM